MKFVLPISWIIIFTFPHARGAKILFFHSIGSYSHRVASWPLAEALSNRGHEITYISPYYPKEPNPNITEFVPINHAKYVDDALNNEFDINLRVKSKMDLLVGFMFDLAYGASEALYSSKEFENWLETETNKKFDLVIVDHCYPESGIALAHKLSAKYMIFSTVAQIAYEYDALGFQPESSSIPELEVDPPTVPMGFFSRLSNSFMSLRWRLAHYLYSNKIDTYLRNVLKTPEMPYIGDLLRSSHLVFYTGDVITDYPRALPPNFVNIAGLHCKESTKALPQDIENFITGANQTGEDNIDGFVYISLGSSVISSNLPDNIKQVFYEAIKSFPNLKFLWKWNGDFPKNIPQNLFLRKWFPQSDVLSNSKIRAFITQSGRPSTLEALFNGVPLISFPILGDQDFNANRLAQVQAAIKLEIGTVTVNELKAAIQKSVYDPSVKARMTKYQTLFRDKPMSPLDTAVWWTEYVLRTEDTKHLRPAGVDQNWFVRRQIDIWAFLTIMFLVFIFGTFKLLSKIAGKFFKVQPKLKIT